MQTIHQKQKWLWIIIIAAAIVLLRLPTFWTPILDVDEAIFANFANRMLDGGIPYVDMVDNKPMGIFYLYAAVFWLFGRGNMIAVHIIIIPIVIFTCYYIYKISILLGGIGRPARGQDTMPVYELVSLDACRVAYWAALSYAIFTTTYIPKFIAAEIEIIMVLPLTMGIYFYLVGEKRSFFLASMSSDASHSSTSSRLHVNRMFLLAGFFTGIALIFKYQAGINLFIIGVYWLWQWRRSKESLINHLPRIIMFAAGSIIPPTLMVIHLLYVGSLAEFVASTLSASASYITAGIGTINVLEQFMEKGATLLVCGYILWIAAGWVTIHLSANITASNKLTIGQRYLIVAWFVFSWIPVIMGGRFYGHYFIQLLPAASILGGIKLAEWWGRVPRLILFSIFFSILASTPSRYMTNFIYRLVGEDHPDDYRIIAEYVKSNTEVGEYIYAWGFAPCIYYFSDRPSSSRFPYSDPLVGRVTGLKNTPENPIDTTSFISPRAWGILWKDFEKHPPKYIIDTSSANLHGYAVYPMHKYEEIMDYVRKNYMFETNIGGALIYQRR